MSTTTITRIFTVGGVPTNMTSVVFRDPTNTFGVRRTDTLATVVATNTALTNTAVGTYSYTITDPAANLVYNYWITFVYAGETYTLEKDVAGGTSTPAVVTTGDPGATVIAAFDALIDEEESAVKLSRYARELEIPEDQFFGINNPATVKESCHNIWTFEERARVARYLKEAQTEIEQVTQFPLSPRWIVDEFKYYGYPVHATWTKIIAAGFRNTSTLQAGAVPSYAADPCVVTVATTATDGIAVFHPGTDIEIYPSSVTVSGGVATILIPRARMVKQSAQNNADTGLTYSDVPPSATSPFEATVDVKRIYNDDSIQGGLYWHHRDSGGTCDCTCDWCCATCGDYTENACIYIRNPNTGALDLLSATYSALTWTANCLDCYCSAPDSVRLNYKAGFTPLTDQIVTMIIRLAHSKMPKPPCGCGFAQEYWERDRKVPDNMSEGQATCRFGNTDGAYFAWKQANAIRFQLGIAM